MDAASSVQVLVAVTVLTTATIAAIRWVGLAAATHHAELPPIPGSAPKHDIHRLVAILTAAAAEMLETDPGELVIHSVAEIASDSGHHWPRQGRFQRHHGRPTTRF